MNTLTENRLPLSDALGFSEDDLERNRNGLLTDSQIARLRGAWRRTLMLLIGGLLALTLAATFFLFLGDETDSPVLTIIGMGLTLVNAAIMGFGATSYLRTQRDLREGRVAVLQGEIRHTIRLTGRNRTYLLDIADERLIVPRPVFNAFEEGGHYHLYRSPATKVLFTAELIDG